MDSIGVDLNKMPSMEDMRVILLEKCHKANVLKETNNTWLTITYNDEAIGFHTIDNLIEGESGIFHAHIYDKSKRKMGIAKHSCPMAFGIYFERFHLKKIIFKTPAQNLGAINVKKALGIRILGEEIISFGA